MTVLTAPIPSNEPAMPAVSPPMRYPRAISTAFASILTFGLFPLFVWPARWGAVLDRDASYFRELAAWWRGRVSENEGDRLNQIVRSLPPRPMLIVLPWLAGMFVSAVIGFAIFTSIDHSTWIRNLILLTYRGHADTRLSLNGNPYFLHQAWMWGLFVGNVLLMHMVHSHVRAVSSLVDWINQRARSAGLPEMTNHATRRGFRPFWIVLALIGICTQLWWLIPLAMAGSLQQQYTRVSMSRLRLGLAQQVRSYNGRAMPIPQAEIHPFCRNQHCGAKLAAVANFCPQCGSPARWRDNRG
jgi:hypothetical protein